MSEFQYYEFQAIDRSLTRAEMAELRKYSTRARITPTSFVNDYQWGNFKGNQDAWMEQYFDALLYLANWGTHILSFRLSADSVKATTARAYCRGGSAATRARGGQVVLTFISETDEGDELCETEGRLSSMISIRSELARGDVRALYLGWLLRLQSGEIGDDGLEPPVPVGLGELSGAQQAMAEFLRIDEALLATAAEHSRPVTRRTLKRADIARRVHDLPRKEKEKALSDYIAGKPAALERLQDAVLGPTTSDPEGSGAPRRTAGALMRAAGLTL
jgi:hypothetical protein